MEWFVKVIVASGSILVAGLWLITSLEAGTLPWLIGGVGVALGGTGLAIGIWSEVEFEAL